jgi:hypothetical protein
VTVDSKEYIAMMATAIREALDDDLPIQVSFCPGNGTRYALMFTPVAAASAYSPGDQVMAEHGVVVSMLNGPGSAYVFDLLADVPIAWYIAEKLKVPDACGAALHILFSAISGSMPHSSMEDATIGQTAGIRS